MRFEEPTERHYSSTDITLNNVQQHNYRILYPKNLKSIMPRPGILKKGIKSINAIGDLEKTLINLSAKYRRLQSWFSLRRVWDFVAANRANGPSTSFQGPVILRRICFIVFRSSLS